MNTDFERILEDCLTRVETGQASVAECIARYPEFAAELRKVLTVAVNLRRLRAPDPPPAFRTNTRASLREFMRAHPHLATAAPSAGRWRPLRGQVTLAFASVALVSLFALFTVSQAALPGDSLYSFNVAGEQIWRTFQSDMVAADVTLTARRADEVIRAKGNARAEKLALENYRAALDALKKYSDPRARQLIQVFLADQKNVLGKADVNVKELDDFIRSATTPAPTNVPTAPPATPLLIEPTTLPTESPTTTAPSRRPTLPILIPTEPNSQKLSTPEPTRQATPDHDHLAPPSGKPTDLPPSGQTTHEPPILVVPGLLSPTPTLPQA